jgi:hypothetical protein
MKAFVKVMVVIFVTFTVKQGNAQSSNYNSLFKKAETDYSNATLRFYGGLSHQHQDYFNQAFSLQGVEGGVILKNNMFFGIYGSAFVSNLEVEIENNPVYILINQAGVTSGYTDNSSKMLHAGLLFNLGYFSLTGNNTKIPVFKIAEHKITLNGLVISPQVFAELNVTKCMKFRTGLAYNFYTFENITSVNGSDLENFSFNFGFIFGKFN